MSEEQDGTITPEPKTPEPKTPAPKPGDDTITTTQAELNKMMAENRRTLTRKNEEMAQQLEALQSTISMTTEERDDLSATIENLRAQTMSQEELAKREAKKAAEAHSQEVNTLKGELDQWKSRYERETISRSIIDAASIPEQKAYDPEQIVALLGGKTRMDSVRNEDTGEESLQVIVSYNHVDEEGKQKVLEVSPTEAVKLMKETKRHANLFLSPNSPGLGGGPNVDSSSAEPDLNDMDAFMRWREKNKSTVYGD